jgi:S-adenosylmethionine:tRNA-ribosyltransferase-isomerase (queuine synthetase)
MVDVGLRGASMTMLVSDFMGVERIRAIKPHAIRACCRSFSNGDASLHLP